MKEVIRKQTVDFLPGSIGWGEKTGGGIASGVCPHCGDSLYFDPEVMDKNYGKVSFFGCSNCDWRDTMMGIPGSADRFGLV